jgi:hypothetical protein
MNHELEMRLPAGRTCQDCGHVERCVALGYTWRARESCDFHPRRFVEAVPPSAIDMRKDQ